MPGSMRGWRRCGDLDGMPLLVDHHLSCGLGHAAADDGGSPELWH